MSDEKETPPWVLPSQAMVAEFFGVSPRTVDSWRRAGLPGKGGAWNLQEILFWLRTAGPWRPKLPADDDELMAGGDSVWLEEYRKERALLARMDREEREEKLVDVETFKYMLMRSTEIHRRTGRKLQAEFGDRAYKLFNDSFEKAAKAMPRYLADYQKKQDKKSK